MRYKTIIYMTIAVAAATSCIERHPDNFGDISSVYFNNRGAGNVLLDTTDVTFVYEPLDETRMEVPVTVQLLGRAVGYDRQVDITVSSDNASEGTDYILPENAILPAGEYSFDYTVTLLRTEALETAKKNYEDAVKALEEKGVRNVVMFDLGPVISSHVGCGTVGIIFHSEK